MPRTDLAPVATVASPPPAAVVRLMSRRDLPAAEALYGAAAAGGFASPASFDPEAGLHLLAEAQGEIAGHAAVLARRGWAELTLVVRGDFRHQGVGLLLVREAVRQARAQRLPALYVFVDVENRAARRALLAFGFHVAGESLGQVQFAFPL